MHATPIHPRRMAAVLLVLAVGFSLAACSRKDKILNPIVTGPVTWTNTVRHLLTDRSEGTTPTGCTSCHHPGTGIPDWSDYNTVVSEAAIIRGRLSTNGDTMRGFLKPGEPEIVVAWIDAGTPF